MLKGSDMTLLSIEMNFTAPVKCNTLIVQEACVFVITVIPNDHHAL